MHEYCFLVLPFANRYNRLKVQKQFKKVHNMYNVARNNFYENQKNATIYTPKGVCDFLFALLHPLIEKGTVFDPCVGEGALLHPFAKKGFATIGVDIEEQGFIGTIEQNFLEVKQGTFKKPALVIANPPFNIDAKTKELAGKILGARPLLPEVWLQHIIHLWGTDVPICLFAPYGLRLNQTVNSKRWKRFVDGTYPPISSIIALPKDIYDDVLFHSEVLIFNVKGLQGHYFYDG